MIGLHFLIVLLPLFDYGDIIRGIKNPGDKKSGGIKNPGDKGNLTLMSDLQMLHNKVARLILDLPLAPLLLRLLRNFHGRN